MQVPQIVENGKEEKEMEIRKRYRKNGKTEKLSSKNAVAMGSCCSHHAIH